MDNNGKRDIKKIIDAVKKSVPKWVQHGQYQMSLGSLIKALKRERTGLPVVLSSVYQGYTDKYPGRPHSYFGYHSDLAFEPSTTLITVADFLKVCETTVGASFIAPDDSTSYYRDHIMKINTPVWISETETASKNAIADVVPTDECITLVTKTIDEDEDKEIDNGR
tara:strand:+ start:713 stop:1210 length:498 start_codon:yes stop_codon:yes gene_type:complete